MTQRAGRNRSVIAIAGAALAVVVVAVVLNTGAGSPRLSPSSPTSTVDPLSSAEPSSPYADIPMVSCGPLLTLDEVEAALAIRARPADEQGSIRFERGEVCSELVAADRSHFVRIEPGDPGDFAPGAQLAAVTGMPVTGVGDDGRWFVGGQESDGVAVGILSVRKNTPLGGLYYRIALGRPDLDGPAQLEIAHALALGALGRFPGVERPEPEVVRFPRDPVVQAPTSYAEYLLAQELSGRWARAEGLVRILAQFAGERDGDIVLDPANTLANSGTDVIRMARKYAESGVDPQASAEITRLLAIVALSPEQLETSSSAEPSPGAATAILASWPGTPALQAGCEFDCFAKVSSPVLDEKWPGKYQLFRPKGDRGWTASREDLALEAIVKSALTLEPLGTMPRVLVYFDSAQEPLSSAQQWDDGCVITLNAPLQRQPRAEFQQRISTEMAQCFIDPTFPEQVRVPTEVSAWWRQGLAVYLGEMIFGDHNVEQRQLPGILANAELGTSLLERTNTNWALFEHIGATGPAAAMPLIRSLATSGGIDNQATHLANAGIEDALQAYSEELTDGRIKDSGRTKIARFAPLSDEYAISGPILLLEEPVQFGTVRLSVKVDPGKVACVAYAAKGDSRVSWRSGRIGVRGGTWTADLPDRLTGTSVFVVTATSPATRVEIEVTDVARDPDCDDSDPEPQASPPDCGICDTTRFYWERLFGV